MRNARVTRGGIVVLAVLGALTTSIPPAAGGDYETHPGNVTCEDVAADWSTIHKAEFDGGAPPAGSHDAVSWVLSAGEDGQVVEWTATTDVAGVLVKGGRNGTAVYRYDPAARGDTLLHAPVNPGGKWADISHITFCAAPGFEPPAETGTIVIEKVTHPADPKAEFAFASSIPGWNPSLRDGETASIDVPAGGYTVSEELSRSTPKAWALSSITCNDPTAVIDIPDPTTGGSVLVDITVGETVTCTFANRRIPDAPDTSTLVIAKLTQPAGAVETFQFTSSVDGFAPALGDGESIGVQVDAGIHSIAEAPTDGWQLTGITCTDPDALIVLATGEATVTVLEGETVLCTYTNTEIPDAPEPGSLVLGKATDPPGAADGFQFTTTVEGWNPILADGESAATDVASGIYTIVEAEADGWRLSAIECAGAAKVDMDERKVQIQVDDGATVTCTFINSRVEQPGSIGDYVWFDANANGIQDRGEPGVPGVTVNLYRAPDEGRVEQISGRLLASEDVAAGMLVATARTDAVGHYLIENVPAGDYIVEFLGLPEGYVFTERFAGASRYIDSDVSLDTGRTGVMVLAAGFVDLTCDAGIIILAQQDDDVLPATGGELEWPAAVGVLLVACGAAMLGFERRRRRAATRR